jgi:hypothetical protein
MADDLTETLSGPRQLKKLGSPAWCLQTVLYLKDHIRHVDEQWRQADQILAELITVRAWDKIPPEHPYGSLDEMLHANTGLYAREIRQRIKQAELAAHGGDRKSADYQGRDTTLIGRGADYVVARLKRDDPGLAEKVVLGEVTSEAAAREKGWRPRRIAVRLDDAESAARTLRKHMTDPSTRRALARLLLDDEEVNDGRESQA